VPTRSVKKVPPQELSSLQRRFSLLGVGVWAMAFFWTYFLVTKSSWYEKWNPGAQVDFWVALGTLVLAATAVVAAVLAVSQLNEAKQQRDQRSNLAAVERTNEFIHEYMSDSMEDILGFFDFAADIRVTRLAFEQLYFKLLQSRPAEIRERKAADPKSYATAVAKYMREDLASQTEVAPLDDRALESRLRTRILTATNLLERTASLVSSGYLDEKLLIESQSYNIAATFYVLQPVLLHFVREENFEFEAIKNLSIKALKPALERLPQDHGLNEADFAPPMTSPTP
jgi:hypothetical protein